MAAFTPRFCWQNFAQFTGSLFTVSGEDSANPHTFALDQLRSKAWVTPLGWTIVEGFNDGIRLTEGVTGAATATIAAGTYATGAALATAVATALNNAATDNTWSCSYSSSTNKFTISHDNVQTGGLLWTNSASTAAIDLGYDDSADDTGATSYEADNVSYQSRHFITVQLPASATVKFAAVLDHEQTATGTIDLLGNSSDSWSSPATTQNLTDENEDSTIKSLFFSDQTYKFWRFVFSDVQNAVGTMQVGLIHLGDYFQPSVAYGVQHNQSRQELTDIQTADQGAVFQDLKAKADVWNLTYNGITDNDWSSFRTMADNRRIGRPFFFFFDPQNDAGEGDYFHFPRPINRQSIPADPQDKRWLVSLSIKQSLG